MVKTVSEADLQQLRESGATVNRPLKVKERPQGEIDRKQKQQASETRHRELTDVVNTTGRSIIKLSEEVSTQSKATTQLAKELSSGQLQLAEQLETVLLSNAQKEEGSKQAYRFTIHRDKQGLIESIDAFPVDS